MSENVDQHEDFEEERDDAVIGVAIRYSLFAVLGLGMIAGIVAAIWIWRNRAPEVAETKPVDLPALRQQVQRELPAIPWTDITDQSGITFRHVNGAMGDKLLPETMGGGCAFFDYNRDGAADILFVNSKFWGHKTEAGSPESAEPAGGARPTLALYENDGSGSFRDVTEQVGLDITIYGQGCAIGDYDNDGYRDIYITAVSENDLQTSSTATRGTSDGIGPNRLFRNAEGSFVDVTESAGVAGESGDWSTSSGWFDYDNDGRLDLWVCNYVDWSREFDLAQNFRLTGGERAYGRPQAFGGSYSRLYRNDGDGRFSDVSEQAGIQINAATTGTPLAKSLGLTFHDFDHNGYLDVMVANDTVQNNLFRNMGDGTFRELATLAGVAFDSEGNARGAMGIDVACPRDDPNAACVAIGNFSNEMTAFYVSDSKSLMFSDQAVANGLGPSTRLFLTFGVFFFDADLDGWDDIFHANGHLEEDIAKVQASQTYEQPPQLFWNAGPSSATEFVPLPVQLVGEDFAKPIAGRGAAYADIDGDGDLDVLIATVGGRPRLLRNDQQLGHDWLRLRLVGNGTTSNRDAIGARVNVALKSGRTISKMVNPTRSYLSQVELPITLGTGEDGIQSLQISWPDGNVQSLGVPEVGQTVEVVQQP